MSNINNLIKNYLSVQSSLKSDFPKTKIATGISGVILGVTTIILSVVSMTASLGISAPIAAGMFLFGTACLKESLASYKEGSNILTQRKIQNMHIRSAKHALIDAINNDPLIEEKDLDPRMFYNIIKESNKDKALTKYMSEFLGKHKNIALKVKNKDFSMSPEASLKSVSECYNLAFENSEQVTSWAKSKLALYGGVFGAAGATTGVIGMVGTGLAIAALVTGVASALPFISIPVGIGLVAMSLTMVVYGAFKAYKTRKGMDENKDIMANRAAKSLNVFERIEGKTINDLEREVGVETLKKMIENAVASNDHLIIGSLHKSDPRGLEKLCEKLEIDHEAKGFQKLVEKYEDLSKEKKIPKRSEIMNENQINEEGPKSIEIAMEKLRSVNHRRERPRDLDKDAQQRLKNHRGAERGGRA